MSEYFYMITGSWSEGPGLVQTRTLVGIFTDDIGEHPTRAAAYDRVIDSFRKTYGLGSGIGVGVLFFSLVPNDRL